MSPGESAVKLNGVSLSPRVESAVKLKGVSLEEASRGESAFELKGVRGPKG